MVMSYAGTAHITVVPHDLKNLKNNKSPPCDSWWDNGCRYDGIAHITVSTPLKKKHKTNKILPYYLLFDQKMKIIITLHSTFRLKSLVFASSRYITQKIYLDWIISTCLLYIFLVKENYRRNLSTVCSSWSYSSTWCTWQNALIFFAMLQCYSSKRWNDIKYAAKEKLTIFVTSLQISP